MLKLKISHLPVMCLFGIFTLSARKYIITFSDDKNLNSFS